MSCYKKGQYIEIGVGDDLEDEDGFSTYVYIDVDGVDMPRIDNLFNRKIIYINQYDSEILDEMKEVNLLSLLLNDSK